MGNRPQFLYKSLKAWQEKGGEAERNLWEAQACSACLGTGVWGLPERSGLETMRGFPQDRAERSTHIGSVGLAGASQSLISAFT